MLSNYSKIPSGDLNSLRIAIATKGPVAVAIDASHKSFAFYGYGVYYEKECGKHKIYYDNLLMTHIPVSEGIPGYPLTFS